MNGAIFERFVSTAPDGRPVVVERLTHGAVVELVMLSPALPDGRRVARWCDGCMALVPAQATPDELLSAYSDAWLLMRLRAAAEDCREAAAAVGAQRALRRAKGRH